MRSMPSRTNRPCPKVRAAVSGRIAVPALPKNNSASSTGILPPSPLTRIFLLGLSSSYNILSFAKASIILRTSSLSSKFSMKVSPSESIASRRTRLDKLFEPGSVMLPEILRIGSSRSCSVMHSVESFSR